MGQIAPVDVVAPGRWGLNSEAGNTLLDPKWSTVALNAVVNRAGRMAARKGWENQTTLAIAATPKIDTIHSFKDAAGTIVLISTAGNKIYKNITDFTDAANDITSATAPSGDHWQFLNFNGKCLGFQRGEVPITRTTGDFADASYTGTGPDGNCAHAAFGRIWAADADLQTVRYSVLLDEADYSAGNGGGTLNMASVWTNGIDEIVAIASVGANLVVFGKNHIVLWADGSGSSIGITASQLEVVDTIEGTGCIARDSIAITGEGDLIFLSRNGLQSLSRVIQSKSNPTVALSKHVQSKILSAISVSIASDAQMDQVRACHNPETGLYLINFPVVDTMFAVDTHHPFDDGEGSVLFPITEWTVGGPIGAVHSAFTGQIYFGASGVVGKYAGNLDNASVYDFDYKSGWLDFGEANHRLKFLKEITGTVVIGSGTVNYNWEFDFTGNTQTRSLTYTAATQSEYNVAEYNIGEFSGSIALQRKTLPAHGEGQFLRLGVNVSVNSFDAVVQALSVSPKLGRAIT